MKKATISIFIITILMISKFTPAQDWENIPITRIKITKDITLYKVGLTGVYSNMTAVRTSEGTVVFDALMAPPLAKRVREMIEADFGKKIACLINTHGASDHTGGNSAFQDVKIYGHSYLKEELGGGTTMRGPKDISPDSLKKLIARFEERQKKEMEGFKKTYPGDVREFDEMEQVRNLIRPLITSRAWVYPTDYVDESYVLEVGNKTFKMYHNTPSYSQSDIMTYIPEDQTIILGDIFNTKRLPYFFPVPGAATDLDSWEKLFAEFVAPNTKVEHFIGTHGEGVITVQEIREQLKYLRKLYNDVKSLKAGGKTAQEVVAELTLDKYPYFSKYNPYFYGSRSNIHSMNITTLFNKLK